MTRFYGLNKESTQRLLDLAVEDNLVSCLNYLLLAHINNQKGLQFYEPDVNKKIMLNLD